MPTDKGSSALVSKTPSSIQIFAYPDLDLRQKLEFERTVSPFDLELGELVYLLSTPFPFDDLTRRWLERYVELSEIYKQEGPLADLDWKMSRWATRQRTYRNQSRLQLERERALNRIGFAWNFKEAIWQRQYENFLAYQKNPQAKVTKSLSEWMSKIRKRWDLLPARQQTLLQEAGFLRQPLVETVQERLKEMEAVFARQGHLRGLNPGLKSFVSSLRHLYQKGKLDPEVQKRCDRMGFKWVARNPPATHWSSFYARAEAYVEQFGWALPASRWTDRELSKWVRYQTSHWAHLSEEKRNLLQKLQIKTQYERRQALWERRYAQAVALHARLGPYRDRIYQDEDYYLKAWMRSQRLKWDQLSRGQRERLEAIGLAKRIAQQKTRRAKSTSSS